MSDKRKSDQEHYNLRKKRRTDFKEASTSDSADEEELEDEENLILDITDLINGALNKISEETKKSPDQLYLDKLPKEERDKLKLIEERINNYNKFDVPLRYKILSANLEDKIKAMVLSKVKRFEELTPMQSEYFKLKNYMDAILKIPFGVYKNLPITRGIKGFMTNLKAQLDKCTFGQEDAKNTIMQILGKWITNPEGKGNIIGLEGPPGVGKTSMIKNGLSKALDMPFSFITLGGSSHSSSLEGFDYTYEGSKWGRIVDILIENKCMNPIIFFDELDKISESKEGMEIISLLIHLTDPSQNNCFHDKYFSGIDFDLSKIFMIFSFNDINKINPILRDRISVVKLNGFTVNQKIKIAQDFLIDKIASNIGIDKSLIVLPEESLRLIINTYCPEQGVRKLEQCLNTLMMKINLFHITKDISNLNLQEKIEINEPYYISPVFATKLLDPIYRKDDMSHSVKMMYC